MTDADKWDVLWYVWIGLMSFLAGSYMGTVFGGPL